MGHMCALGHIGTSRVRPAYHAKRKQTIERPVANLGAQTLSATRSRPLTSSMQKEWRQNTREDAHPADLRAHTRPAPL
eukprot:5735334-Prymnesium_polylepis.1